MKFVRVEISGCVMLANGRDMDMVFMKYFAAGFDMKFRTEEGSANRHCVKWYSSTNRAPVNPPPSTSWRFGVLHYFSFDSHRLDWEVQGQNFSSTSDC